MDVQDLFYLPGRRRSGAPETGEFGLGESDMSSFHPTKFISQGAGTP